MIFQGDWTRLVLILIPTPFLAAVFIYLAYKVLKRKRDRPSLLLAVFYVFSATGLVLSVVFSLFAEFEPTPLPLPYVTMYYITSFFLIFSYVFIPIFIINLLKLEFTLKNIFTYIILHAIGSVLIITVGGIVFSGITLDPLNSWRPTYTWSFMVSVYFFFTVLISIPTLYYSIKLYKSFSAPNLKVRLAIFLIGVYGMLAIFYGVTLYNTWQEDYFRIIWSILSFFLTFLSGVFILYGIGPSL